LARVKISPGKDVISFANDGYHLTQQRSFHEISLGSCGLPICLASGGSISCTRCAKNGD